jgi:hypothetical protein
MAELPPLDYDDRKWEHFSLTVGTDEATGTNDRPVRSDGTFPVGPLLVTVSGERYGSGKVTVTLTNGRSKGSFTAASDSGERISGSFTC